MKGIAVAGVCAYAAVAYVYDVLLRPATAAAVMGPTRWGDVNCDVAARREVSCAQQNVCYCDAHSLPYPDKHFGAVIASHVIEHVDDPVAALRELHRVADEVFVLTPLWWCPHTWLHPGHQWYRRTNGSFYPWLSAPHQAPMLKGPR